MKLDTHKKKAGILLKVSPKRVRFDKAKLAEIKEAITKTDLRGLIRDGTITSKQKKGVSRVRARKIQKQRAKGLRKGAGRRKGSANARVNTKTAWQNKARSQRKFIKQLKDKQNINNETYRMLYSRIKGGFFRSIRHIKIYLEEQGLYNDTKKKA